MTDQHSVEDAVRDLCDELWSTPLLPGCERNFLALIDAAPRITGILASATPERFGVVMLNLDILKRELLDQGKWFDSTSGRVEIVSSENVGG